MQVKILKDLIGKTITKINSGPGDDEMSFETSCGDTYRMYHEQDCCETVRIEDVVGDIECLIGSPVLMAEEVTNDNNVNPDGVPIKTDQESFTWTFYKFATINGYVTVRWYGDSNGFYSEEVTFEKIS